MNSLTEPARVTLQVASTASGVPDAKSFGRWVNCALEYADRPLADHSCVTIRIVDEAESRALNSKYRDIAKPTNVLAFSAANDDHPCIDDPEVELGDLVVCADVVLREAQEQLKPAEAHFAHMAVHGSLHLLGYDHMTDQGAMEMETLEKQVMDRLGFPDPYGDNNQDLMWA